MEDGRFSEEREVAEPSAEVAFFQLLIYSRAIWKLIDSDWSKVAKKNQMTSGQQFALFMVYSAADKRMTMSNLAKCGLWHLSTVLHLTKKLEKDGYLSFHAIDGRTTEVILQPIGEALVTEVMQEMGQFKLFSYLKDDIDWQKERTEQFIQMMNQLTEPEFSEWYKRTMSYMNTKIEKGKLPL